MESKDTVTPANIELEEKQDDKSKEKKRTRFKSPISASIYHIKRHILRKIDDHKPSSYYRLKEEKQYSDLQFKETPTKVPIHAIILAVVLFIIGSVMIIIGALMLTGYIQTQYKDRTWPLILIGSLVFLPGFYHLRIAYWAWKGDKDFSFADIPDLDWF